MIEILPPLAAYRADLALARRPTIGAADAEWLALSVAVQRLSTGSDRIEQRLRALDTQLIAFLGETARPLLDPSEDVPPSPLARLRALAERMEDAAAWSMTAAMLHAGAQLADTPLESGRLWSHQARLARQLGDVDVANHLYHRSERAGRGARIPELRVRAWLGFAALNQVRGNYPELERWARKAIGVTVDAPTLAPLASLAHHFLLVRAGARGDLAAAIIHGWDAYRLSLGEPTREAERLLNVAQAFLDAGAPEVAISGFTAALQQLPPARLALPAWGGLSVAAAALRDRALVERSSTKVLTLAEGPAPAYAVAGALGEAARARSSVGLSEAQWRTRAVLLAQSYGFHQVAFEADMLQQATARVRNPAKLSSPSIAADVARIREMVAEFATRDDAHALA